MCTCAQCTVCTRILHYSMCVCLSVRKGRWRLCHCHLSKELLWRQSHVLVHSAIFTLTAILRSVITHF